MYVFFNSVLQEGGIDEEDSEDPDDYIMSR